jgi:hypothetical protein
LPVSGYLPSVQPHQGDCKLKMIMSLAKIKLNQRFSQPSKPSLSPMSSSAKAPNCVFLSSF